MEDYKHVLLGQGLHILYVIYFFPTSNLTIPQTYKFNFVMFTYPHI